jgi:hypothetical protein
LEELEGTSLSIDLSNSFEFSRHRLYFLEVTIRELVFLDEPMNFYYIIDRKLVELHIIVEVCVEKRYINDPFKLRQVKYNR